MNHGNKFSGVKRVLRATRNEIAADTLAFAAGMGSAAIMHNTVCGVVNGAARGYYDAAGVQLAVKKHRWSKEVNINSKALTGKVHSARIIDGGWWFNPATCKKVTDTVATTSVICGAVAGGATRGIIKDVLSKGEETWDSDESWDSYPEETEETAEE